MNPHYKHGIVLLLAAALLSCSASEYAVTPNGDTARVDTKGGASIEGELLCIQDSSVYLVGGTLPAKVIRISASDLKRVEIQGYANRSWVVPVLVFELLPAALMGIAAASYDGGDSHPGAIALATALPGVLTFLLFEVGTPSPPEISGPEVSGELHRLTTYARFPGGLTEMQMQSVLKSYDQTAAEIMH